MTGRGKVDRSYEVGYGKPPKANHFKPGQSGNPRGRKKGAKSLEGVMRAALNEKVSVEIGGRSVRMSKLEALTKRLLASALKGDISASRLLISMMQATGMHHPVEEALQEGHMQALIAEDANILQRYARTAQLSEPGLGAVGTDGLEQADGEQTQRNGQGSQAPSSSTEHAEQSADEGDIGDAATLAEPNSASESGERSS
ncbi:MAG: DUF5681 domain-containing protein [Pseudomonadota bacterium]